MNVKGIMGTTMIIVFAALTGCTDAPAPNVTAIGRVGKEFLEARKFPEIELWTAGEVGARVKLIRVEGEQVVFLPFPYWNVETRRATVFEIRSLRIVGAKNRIVSGVLNGVGTATCLFGFLGLTASTYDEDYRGWLMLAPLGGLFYGAPAGLLAGAISAAASPTRYEFSKLNEPRKYAVLRRLMGR